LAGFRIRTVIVHEGEDADQIIKEMEARGEIPDNLPAGQTCAILHHVISPPNGEPNWERYITSRSNLKIAEAQACGKSLLPEKLRSAGDSSAGSH
jgi:hypothetical protein